MGKAKMIKQPQPPAVPLVQAPMDSRSTVKFSYEDMLVESIKALGNVRGSSMIAIKRYMANNFQITTSLAGNIHLKRGLEKALQNQRIVRLSGTAGLTGSFKLVTNKNAKKKETKMTTVAATTSSSTSTSGLSKAAKYGAMKTTFAAFNVGVSSKTIKVTSAKTTTASSVAAKSSTNGTKRTGNKKPTVSASVGTLSSKGTRTTRVLARKQTPKKSMKTPAKMSSRVMNRIVKPIKKLPTLPSSFFEDEEETASNAQDESDGEEDVTHTDESASNANVTEESIKGEATINTTVEQGDVSAVSFDPVDESVQNDREANEEDSENSEEEDDDDSEEQEDSQGEEEDISPPILKTEVAPRTTEVVQKNIPSVTTHNRSELFDNTEADTQLIDENDDLDSNSSFSELGFHREETNDESTNFQDDLDNHGKSRQVIDGGMKSTVDSSFEATSADSEEEGNNSETNNTGEIVNETGDESSIANDTSTGGTTGNDGDTSGEATDSDNDDDDDSRYSPVETVPKVSKPLKETAIVSPPVPQQHQSKMLTRDKLEKQWENVPSQQQKQDAVVMTVAAKRRKSN